MNDLEAICSLSPSAVAFLIAVVGLLKQQPMNQVSDYLSLECWQRINLLGKQFGIAGNIVDQIRERYCVETIYANMSKAA